MFHTALHLPCCSKEYRVASYQQAADAMSGGVGDSHGTKLYSATLISPLFVTHLPPAQQAALKAAFQHYSIATYVSHFDAFAGERFDLYPPAGGSDAVVRVKIVPGKLGDDAHVLGYAMRQTPAGWKAIDVTADSSVSQVVAQQEEIRSLSTPRWC
jgi:ABC-type transporter MlaC component